VSVCECDPQTPKEYKVEMEETWEVNIDTVTTVISKHTKKMYRFRGLMFDNSSATVVR